eukprot:gene19507-25403_t
MKAVSPYETTKTSEPADIEKVPSAKGKEASFFHKSPQSIKWINLNFKVGKKDILKDCWGDVESGKVCAIMGPSGAGKSSLLNVLAGRSAPAPGITINGRVNVGGTDINPVAYRQNIAYVMQDDALMGTATPREAIEFSAKLRLPPTTTSEEIHNLVDGLLEELGLTVCADVLIGSALVKGISGGQKKRTSVGIELITNPALLFCDEPTSGLDSFSAFNCIKLLKKIASFDTTVLCTIHQPSSEVFFLFDQVIFMNNGRIFYHGASSTIVNYFSKFNYHCPEDYNPSDYVMFINQSVDPLELEKSGVFMFAPPDNLFNDKQLTQEFTGEITVSIKSGYLRQIYLLSEREIVNTRRDTGALASRFGITIFLNLLYGLIFYNAGGKDDSIQVNFNSHFGAIFMIGMTSMFFSATPIMLSFPFERPLFLREYSTGTYSAMSYFLSKVWIELPLTFLQTVVTFLLVYFLMDLQGSWILLVLVNFAQGAASCSVALMLGCAVPNVKDVNELAPVIYVPQILFTGFFISLSQIPIWLRWAQYLCSFKYAMNLMILIEFQLSRHSCSGGAQENCLKIHNDNDVYSDLIWFYCFMLFILFFAFRLGGAIILVQKAKRFY